MSEKFPKEEEIEEETDYNEDESWKYVKVYDPSVVEEKRLLLAKTNRIYRRKDDDRVYISYEDKNSRYQEGMY